MTDPDPTRSSPPPDGGRRLPSRPAGGATIAGILGTLDHALTNRPRPVAQIEERYREPWATTNGVTIEGLDQPVERRERPDRSRARL